MFFFVFFFKSDCAKNAKTFEREMFDFFGRLIIQILILPKSREGGGQASEADISNV